MHGLGHQSHAEMVCTPTGWTRLRSGGEERAVAADEPLPKRAAMVNRGGGSSHGEKLVGRGWRVRGHWE